MEPLACGVFVWTVALIFPRVADAGFATWCAGPFAWSASRLPDLLLGIRLWLRSGSSTPPGYLASEGLLTDLLGRAELVVALDEGDQLVLELLESLLRVRI